MTVDTYIQPFDTAALNAAAASGVERAPLSFGQEQLWFLDQLSRGETTYNILLVWRLRGPLDVALLGRCLDLIVARHPALRTTISAQDGRPFQTIRPIDATAPALQVVDLTGIAADEREQAVQDQLHAESARPFDLERGPLYRFTLFEVAKEEYVLCHSFHHVVTDGWSSAVMNAEISAAYQALQRGAKPPFTEVMIDYPEFSRQQRDPVNGQALEDDLRFWEQRLEGLPTLELPTDRPRPPDGNHRGGSVIRDFPADMRELVQSLADEHGASPFMVLAAAFAAVLSRYSGQDDIAVGVPMLGRPDPELEHVVGLFTNMTVLRSDVSGDPSFAEIIERTTDASMELYEHQGAPFHQVVDRVSPVRDATRNPLFQVAIQLLGGSTSGDTLDLPGVSADHLLLPSMKARFDLALNFIDSGELLKASVEYSADLFDRWRIEAMLGHLETMLRTAATNPDLRLSELPLLTAAEQAELLSVGRGDVVSYRRDLLHETVAKAAKANPDSIALVCRGVELTYAEFDRRADQLARYLRARGLRAGQVVAVLIDRDLDAYVALLGVLKAGGTFTVLDPKLPATRIDFILRDTSSPIVITRKTFADRLPASVGWRTVLIDDEWDRIQDEPADAPLEEWATPETLAYVLYTSGSTGAPKGVMIAHRAVSFFVEAYRRTFDFGPEDRLLQLPSLTFDMSQGEMWTAFSVGATVVAVSPEEASSPEALSALMREQRVTYAGLPPAMLSVIEPDPYPALKYVMGGAEVLPPELVNKWNRPGRTFVNLYGPTEAAVACTEYVCEHTEWRTSPPIGRPHVNRQVYVVDRSNNLVPRGVAGELLIGGEPGGLAEGYLNQPELTAEKFVADPIQPNRTVYRSGDLVRWNSDLQLEFIGRTDQQVKLRGLRIELGEIESALGEHPAVDRAVVLMRPDRQGENQLVGYVTGTDGSEPDRGSLGAHLAERLPEYMIPRAWVVLKEFPLSSGWKIDRKALPEPVADDGGDEDYVAPVTATEERVATIVGEVLDLRRVGAQDSFFQIGGNSLQAMRVISRINKTFGIKISIRVLYGRATVAAIAAAIDERLAERAGGVESG